MAYSCVRVYFEIGHESVIRNKRTPEGFTHDWEVFVRGADNADIHHFVEKVVFNLHNSFPNHKRIIKQPPYVVKESGYAGFKFPIDIYLKTKDENRKIRFYYDLTLQNSGPRIVNVIREKADFPNPVEDFRRRLIKGGGVGVGNDGSSSLPEKTPHNNNVSNSHLDDSKLSSSPHPTKPKVSNNNGEQLPKKHKPKVSEDSRGSNSFAALFGTPIKTVKHSPNSSKPPSRPPSSSSDKHEKQGKESSKQSKHSPQKEKDREKDKDGLGISNNKREKDAEKNSLKEKEKQKDKDLHKEKAKEKVSKKPSSPLPPAKELVKKDENIKKIVLEEPKEKPVNLLKSDNVKSEKKHKEKKNKEEKEKKEKHRDKDNEKKDIEKMKPIEKLDKKMEAPKELKEPKEKAKELLKLRNSVEKEDKKTKTHEKDKDKCRDPEKPKHKHKKKDKHKKDEEREKKKEKKELEKLMDKSPPKPISPPKSPSPPPRPASRTKPANNPLSKLLEELSDKETDSDFSDVERKPELRALSPLSTSPQNPPPSLVVKEEEFKPLVFKEEKEKKKKEKKPKSEKEEGKKRKRKTKDKEEASPAKIVKIETKDEHEETPSPPSPLPQSSRGQQTSSSPPATSLSDDYVLQLKDLQRRIMTIDDNAELQRVVQVVSETGQYVITQRTFDFDLVSLDPSIIKRLQDILITAS